MQKSQVDGDKTDPPTFTSPFTARCVQKEKMRFCNNGADANSANSGIALDKGIRYMCRVGEFLIPQFTVRGSAGGEEEEGYSFRVVLILPWAARPCVRACVCICCFASMCVCAVWGNAMCVCVWLAQSGTSLRLWALRVPKRRRRDSLVPKSSFQISISSFFLFPRFVWSLSLWFFFGGGGKNNGKGSGAKNLLLYKKEWKKRSRNGATHFKMMTRLPGYSEKKYTKTSVAFFGKRKDGNFVFFFPSKIHAWLGLSAESRNRPLCTDGLFFLPQ